MDTLRRTRFAAEDLLVSLRFGLLLLFCALEAGEEKYAPTRRSERAGRNAQTLRRSRKFEGEVL